MNRRDFLKSAAALAAAGAFMRRGALAGTQGANRNNPIWLMTSAFPGETFESVVKRAKSVGAQGLELCVFPRDTDRSDHVATHLEYENFSLDVAYRYVSTGASSVDGDVQGVHYQIDSNPNGHEFTIGLRMTF